MSRQGLTHRQQCFCDEYLLDLNGTQAAIRAGCKPRTANRTAAKWLSNPVIRSNIDAAMAARAERTRITADRVLRELATVGFSRIADYAVDDAGDLSLRPDADPD